MRQSDRAFCCFPPQDRAHKVDHGWIGRRGACRAVDSFSINTAYDVTVARNATAGAMALGPLAYLRLFASNCAGRPEPQSHGRDKVRRNGRESEGTGMLPCAGVRVERALNPRHSRAACPMGVGACRCSWKQHLAVRGRPRRAAPAGTIELRPRCSLCTRSRAYEKIYSALLTRAGARERYGLRLPRIQR